MPGVKRQNRWERNFRDLQRFQRCFGHCRVGGDVPELRPLARWVALQRDGLGRLNLDQLWRLFDLGFDFGKSENRWLTHFFELFYYKLRNGHCNPHRREKGGESLWLWVITQRGLRSKLSLERLRRLNEIGFDWDPVNTQWEERFAQLKEFHRAHGHSHVPFNWKANPQLATWVEVQRRNKNIIRPDRARRLNQFGFIWDPYLVKWQKQFEGYKAFLKRDTAKPISRRESRIRVGWANHQRTRRRFLAPSQIAQLDAIGFDWAPFDNLWEKNFRKLAAFQKRFGHCMVPQKWREDSRFGAWANRLRSERVKRQLTPARIEQLNQLGFEWDYRFLPGISAGLTERKKRVSYWEAFWEKRYAELQDFQKRHGHCRVPADWAENPALGMWVTRQRMFRKMLSRERVRRLTKIGFIWNARRKASAELSYRRQRS